jgi:hypothetical protein
MAGVCAASRIRGTAAGALTAALAVAAHGMSGGMLPTGGLIALLVVLSATFGLLTATLSRADDGRVLAGLLSVGQLAGHLLLSAGHGHGRLSPAMLACHAAAVIAAAAAIALGGRLAAALSRTARAAVRTASVPPMSAPAIVATQADQPLRSALLLATSVSHRGPPVGFAH